LRASAPVTVQYCNQDCDSPNRYGPNEHALITYTENPFMEGVRSMKCAPKDLSTKYLLVLSTKYLLVLSTYYLLVLRKLANPHPVGFGLSEKI
jgi:hypothetical protein